jgi:dihydroxy-acid dehydratase
MIGHVSPEAASGGPIALLQNGDTVTIDVKKRSVDVGLSNEEITERRAKWRSPTPKYTKGVFAKYARLTTSASRGAVCVVDN